MSAGTLASKTWQLLLHQLFKMQLDYNSGLVILQSMLDIKAGRAGCQERH